MEDIFLGEPSPQVKAWIIEHYGQYALPQTRVTFADGAISSYNWSGDLTYATISSEPSIGWNEYDDTDDVVDGEWAKQPKSVDIGTNVTCIGDDAFGGCTALTNVVIHNSVTKLDEWAFYGCTGLSNMHIPNSVSCIGTGVFEGCSALMQIMIPDSVLSIGDYAFLDCNGLANENGFVIVRNVIYSYAGNNECIVIPDGVSAIGSWAFSEHEDIVSAVIGNDVVDIRDGAFGNCTNLSCVTVGNSLEHIGEFGFSETRFQSLTLPNSVSSIEQYAFSGSRLGQLTIDKTIAEVIEMDYFSWYLIQNGRIYCSDGWIESIDSHNRTSQIYYYNT